MRVEYIDRVFGGFGNPPSETWDMTSKKSSHGHRSPAVSTGRIFSKVIKSACFSRSNYIILYSLTHWIDDDREFNC
jgi:hypothetical protein